MESSNCQESKKSEQSSKDLLWSDNTQPVARYGDNDRYLSNTGQVVAKKIISLKSF